MSKNRIPIRLHHEEFPSDPNHKYIQFSDGPPKGSISQASAILTRYYLNERKQSLKEWKKDKRLYRMSWTKPKSNLQIQSKGISYLLFSKILKENGSFISGQFDLPEMECFWMDCSIDYNNNSHYFKGSDKAVSIVDGTPQQQFGESYPIKPKLDREGHIFTTFQPQLLDRIIRERRLLIENSHEFLTAEWVFDLRNLINDTISLLDITLNQLYIKAEYSPEPGWSFDKEKMGEKYSRRLKDKLSWVRQITGRPLEIESEFASLETLRKVRNHLNHFDPPTLVVTLDEATKWLNDVLSVGHILIKIRETLQVPVCSELLNLILQKEAVINPEKAFKERLPLIEGEAGYTTSIWISNDIYSA
jgi:hypothetical protein